MAHRIVEICRLMIMVIDLILLVLLARSFRRTGRRWLAMGVATLFALTYLPERLVYPNVERWFIEREAQRYIREDRTLAVLLHARPDLTNEALNAVRNAMRSREASGDGRYQNRISAILTRVFPDYAAVAPDESVLLFARAIVTILTKLEREDPELCAEWLRPEGGVPSLGPVVGVDVVTELERGMSDVVEGGLSRAQDPPNAARARETLERVAAEIESRSAQPSADREESGKSSVRNNRLCSTARRMYEGCLTLPEKEASNALRYLWSRRSPESQHPAATVQ
jgi:hypothetical protein